MSKKLRPVRRLKPVTANKIPLSPDPSWPVASGKLIAACILVFLVSALIYANNFDHDFVYDDGDIIKNNERIRSLGQATSLFETPYWGKVGNDGLYRPITLLSYALNYHFSQLSPPLYHVANNVLHGLNSVLILLIACWLFQSISTGLCAGLLFALHPIHSEAVNWVVGRADLLAALYVLLALFFSLYPTPLSPGVHRTRTGAILFACLLGVLSKENAIVAVALVLTGLFLSSRPTTISLSGLKSLLKKQIGFLVGWVGVMAVWWMLRSSTVGSNIKPIDFFDNQLVSASRLERVWTALSVFTLCLKKLLFPVSFSVDYGPLKLPTLQSPLHFEVLLAALVLGCLALVCFKSCRHKPWVSFWIAFFLVAYLPTSNLVMTIGTIFGERFLYLPSAAFCVLLGYGLCHLPRRWMTIVLLISVCLFYGIMTYRRNGDWATNLTLFAHEYRNPPVSARALRNYAKQLETADPTQSLRIYKEVLQTFPNYVPCHLGLGTLLIGQGEHERAIHHLSRANQLQPNNPVTLLNLGAAYAGRHQWSEAAHCWEDVIRIDPANQIAQINMSRVREGLK